MSLTAPEGEVRRLRTRKQLALLLMLALRAGRPHGREQLVELLWSDDEPRAARHSLAQSISLLNKLLGCDAIELAGKDQVRLREGVVWLDVDAFEAAAGSGCWNEARELWRGNLLEGLWVRSAPGFERWVDGERQRLLRVHRDVLHHVVESERAAGDWAAMRRTAEALLASDPLDEAAMLVYLEAIALGGDRTLALRTYKEFEERLDAELGATPGPSLRCWIKRQRQGDTPAPALPPRVAETLTLPAPRPVFGREDEFAFLWDGWAAAQRSDGRFVILEGVAGIGKSALAIKLANQVHVSGGSVCFARCWRTEKSVPFAPITAIIRQLMRLPGFVGLAETWISELSRLVPELRERYPTVPPPMAIDDSARHRICDATLQAADCVAYESPLLIVVDDIQNADEATLALLHYFGRQTADKPTMLLCVARSGALESELQRTFIETARSASIANFLELPPLPSQQSVRIARQTLAERGIEVPDWALKTLHEHSEGVPLRLIEASMALPKREGRDDQAWLGLLQRHLGAEPETFETSSAERLASLPLPAKRVACLLAVSGRQLDDYELAAISGLQTTELASGVSMLEQANFVRRNGAELVFVHDQYNVAAREIVEPHEERAIHASLGKLLERSAAENPSARYEVAVHYDLAGAADDACRQALQASRYAGSIGAVREKALALELVLKHMPRAAYASELADAYLLLKEFDRIRAICQRFEAEQLPGAMRAEFAYFRLVSRLHSSSGDLSSTAEELHRLITGSPAFPHRLDAMIQLMRFYDRLGKFASVRRLAREIRRHAKTSDNGSSETYALFAQGYVLAKYYGPLRAIPVLERALARAGALKNWNLELLCRAALGATYAHSGRYHDSLDQYDFALALARKTLDPHGEIVTLNNRAVTEMALGDLAACQAHLEEALRLEARIPDHSLGRFPSFNMAVLMYLRGCFQEAAERFESWYDAHNKSEAWVLTLEACAGRALCAVRTEDKQSLKLWIAKLVGHIAESETSVGEISLVEGALAWHSWLIDEDGVKALGRLDKMLARIRKQSVDHWLRLSLERIRIIESMQSIRSEVDREKLAATARCYKARGVEADALNY